MSRYAVHIMEGFYEIEAETEYAAAKFAIKEHNRLIVVEKQYIPDRGGEPEYYANLLAERAAENNVSIFYAHKDGRMIVSDGAAIYEAPFDKEKLAKNIVKADAGITEKLFSYLDKDLPGRWEGLTVTPRNTQQMDGFLEYTAISAKRRKERPLYKFVADQDSSKALRIFDAIRLLEAVRFAGTENIELFTADKTSPVWLVGEGRTAVLFPLVMGNSENEPNVLS